MFAKNRRVCTVCEPLFGPQPIGGLSSSAHSPLMGPRSKPKTLPISGFGWVMGSGH